MDALRQLPRLRDRLLGVLERFVDQLSRRPVVGQRAARELQGDDRVHQTLLGAIVQVPLDPPAGLVGSLDDPAPRCGELGAALGVRDRGRDELREPRHACLGIRTDGVRVLEGRDDDAPGTAGDDDRGGHRRAGARLEQALAAVDGQAGIDVQRGIGDAIAGDHGRRPVILVAQEPGRVRVEQLTDLDRDGLEQLGGVATLGDEGRHAAQCRLLVGEHPVVRDVARGGVDEAALGERPRRPLQPADDAVGPQEAVHEVAQVSAAARAPGSRPASSRGRRGARNPATGARAARGRCSPASARRRG